MRSIGTQAHGIRLPIITKGDDLPAIVVDSLATALKDNGITLRETDIIGVTEAIVAKAQGNFATLDDIAKDIRKKFPGGTVGVVFPIMSRNRFLNILKGISRGADKVYVLLGCPSDEMGNPVMDMTMIDELEPMLKGAVPAAKFRTLTKNFKHPFTDIDYMDLYEKAGSNIEVFVSKDPRDILTLTKQVLIGETHARFRTAERLKKAGAETVYTLSDILSAPADGSGYNPEYGVLGSNLATDESLKLFPRDSTEFVDTLREKIFQKLGVKPEALVYGDGAFKDPACGIWELADPVVSPGHSPRLGNRPNELKIKYVAENVVGNLTSDEKRAAITKMIAEKNEKGNNYNEGTTPRKYADLIGSLCDLMSGSGDKGTPVILIRGYFDDYSME